jgi:uncharacterized phiE125 gp8 family phage protein
MGLKLITAATDYPVTLDEAKAQTRVDGAADDATLTALIAAATDYVEQYTGRAIMPQTWELVLDAFSDAIQIPKGPVTGITSVSYYDINGALQTVTDTNYTPDLVSDPQWLVRDTAYTWPTTATGINVVKIQFTAGYATVPPSIKHAILLLVSQWFDERSSLSAMTRPAAAGGDIPELPHAVTALLSNYRSFAF